MRKARYSYSHHMGAFKVYDDETGEKVFQSHDEETARRETYRLNGWDYKPKRTDSKNDK